MEKTIKELILAKLGLYHDVKVSYDIDSEYYLINIDDWTYSAFKTVVDVLGAEKCIEVITDMFLEEKKNKEVSDNEQ